jgi:ketosteroid isomerase-like protein
MSQENVEVVRAVTEAGNRADIEAGVALLTSDVIWEENADQELDRIPELSGDRVFTENVLTAHGKGSGVPAELRYWALYWIREGKIARRQVFWSREEAFAGAGLTE